MNLAVLGITPSQSMQPQYHFKGKILLVATLEGLRVILNCAFLFNEAHTFREYTRTTYITSSTIMAIIYFVILVFKMATMFELIDCFEKVIDGSE